MNELAQRRLEAIRRRTDLRRDVTYCGAPLSELSREDLELILAANADRDCRLMNAMQSAKE